MNEIRLGTVGSGEIVRHILDGIRITDGITLTAVFSRSEEKGRALARSYGCSRVYTDFDAMLRDPEVNAVYVAAPNSLHYKYTKAALLAGKHVLCEKPFCPELWQAQELFALAYGRDLTAYGTLTVKEENAEEGTITYSLSMPTRLTMIHEERSAVTTVVDTANWPAGNPAEDVAPGFTYTLNARAETETWENAADFIAAYGRTYEIVCDTTNGTMTVTITSNNGEQIPADAAVTPVEAPAA